MAESPIEPRGFALLRGLFGSLQTGAAERRTTAAIWSDLRANAGSWQLAAQGAPQPYDPAELDTVGRQILSAQGVNGATVSSFRGTAGSWLAAKQRLHGLDDQAQITGREIFTAPWARTADASTPSRYRLRTQWQFTNANGDTATVWRSGEIEGPITSKSDLFPQTVPRSANKSDEEIASAQDTPTLTDYEIEQI